MSTTPPPAVPDTNSSHPTLKLHLAELPERLVRVSGAAVIVIGCVWLVGLQPLGLLLVYSGRRLLLDPGGGDSPWVEALVDLLRRWRGT